MNDQLFKTILHYVNIKCPNKRTPKYSANYYLTNIIDLLSDFVTWKSLQKSIHYRNFSKFHYKTIADIYKLWSDKDVYQNAYIDCSQKNNIVKDSNNIRILSNIIVFKKIILLKILILLIY